MKYLYSKNNQVEATVECVISHEGLDGGEVVAGKIELNIQSAPDIPKMRIEDADCNELTKIRLVCEDNLRKSNPP